MTGRLQQKTEQLSPLFYVLKLMLILACISTAFWELTVSTLLSRDFFSILIDAAALFYWTNMLVKTVQDHRTQNQITFSYAKREYK